MNSIPDDVLKIIIQKLYIHDFINFIKTCKQFYNLHIIDHDNEDKLNYLNIEVIYKKSYELGIIKIYNPTYNRSYKYNQLTYYLQKNKYSLEINNFAEIHEIYTITLGFIVHKIHYYDVMKFCQPPRNESKFMKYMYFSPKGHCLYFHPPGYERLININMLENLLNLKKFFIETKYLNMEKFQNNYLYKLKDGWIIINDLLEYVNVHFIIEEIVNCFNIEY